MRCTARNNANVARWLLRSRFFAVAPTLSANVAVAPTRSAISPAGPLCPSSPRCPSLTQKRVDAKRVLCWAGAMQLRCFHAALGEHPVVDDFLCRNRGLMRDAVDYNNEMRRLMRERSYSRVLDLFEEMKSRGITIDVGIYTLVMKAHSRMNNLDMVKQVFDDVITSGIKPDKFLFNTLIFAYANTGEVDAAFETFHKMQKDYNIPPNPVAYRSLITVCGSGKDVNRAKETFNETIERFGVEDVRNLNVLFEVYAENADSDTGEAYLQECKDLLASMKSKGIRPQAFTYVPLIKLCGKVGRSDEALAYMKESVSSNVEIALASFDHVFRSLIDLEATDEKLETCLVYCLERMKELRMKPSHFTFEGIVDLYEARGDVSKALEFLMKLSKETVDPVVRSGESFAAQLEIIQRLWDCGRYSQGEALAKTSEVLERMKLCHILLSYRGYRTWFIMCLKASDVERALECWNTFTRGNRRPSAGMTQSMIQLALEHDRVDDAVRVLKVAQQIAQNDRKNQITMPEGPYETILAYCAGESDTENAKAVFEYMKKAKVEPNAAIQKHLGTLQLG